MIQSSARRPLATGRLAKTPFPHLLLYLYEHRYTGTLTLQGVEQVDATRLRFDHGFANGAVAPNPSETLAMTMMPLCGLTDGDYAFYAGEDLVGHSSGVTSDNIDPYPFLARALRVHACDAAVDNLLARYDGTPLGLQPGIDLGRFGLRDDERVVADLLSETPRSLDAVVAIAPLQPQRVRRLLYLLLITKAVTPRRVSTGTTGPRFSNFPPPTQAGRQSVVPPAPPVPGSAEARVWETPERGLDGADWQRLVRSTRPPPADMLAHALAMPSPPAPGFPSSSTQLPAPPVVYAPIPGVAPPPRTPAPPVVYAPVPSASPPGSMPVDAPSSASPPGSMPVDAPSSASPPGSMAPPPSPLPVDAPSSASPPGSMAPPPGSMAPPPGPDGILRRVELLCERERYGDALRELDPLLQSHGDQSRVQAMRAWVIFHQAAGEAVAPDALSDSLTEALRLDPLQPRALYVAGLQRKREGRMVEAHRYFTRACGLDMEALGSDDELRLAAERELRLLDMRRRGR